MASLGEITSTNVEPIIREELLRLGRDTTSPAAEPESAGSGRPVKRAAKRPAKRPAKRTSPPSRRASKPAAAAPQSEYDDYPASLRDPRATMQRAAYDALLEGPKDLRQVLDWCAEKRDMDPEATGNMWSALNQLHVKGLAEKPEKPGGNWRLA